jgi:hypothetical protein
MALPIRIRSLHPCSSAPNPGRPLPERLISGTTVGGRLRAGPPMAPPSFTAATPTLRTGAPPAQRRAHPFYIAPHSGYPSGFGGHRGRSGAPFRSLAGSVSTPKPFPHWDLGWRLRDLAEELESLAPASSLRQWGEPCGTLTPPSQTERLPHAHPAAVDYWMRDLETLGSDLAEALATLDPATVDPYGLECLLGCGRRLRWALGRLAVLPPSAVAQRSLAAEGEARLGPSFRLLEEFYPTLCDQLLADSSLAGECWEGPVPPLRPLPPVLERHWRRWRRSLLLAPEDELGNEYYPSCHPSIAATDQERLLERRSAWWASADADWRDRWWRYCGRRYGRRLRLPLPLSAGAQAALLRWLQWEWTLEVGRLGFAVKHHRREQNEVLRGWEVWVYLEDVYSSDGGEGDSGDDGGFPPPMPAPPAAGIAKVFGPYPLSGGRRFRSLGLVHHQAPSAEPAPSRSPLRSPSILRRIRRRAGSPSGFSPTCDSSPDIPEVTSVIGEDVPPDWAVESRRLWEEGARRLVEATHSHWDTMQRFAQEHPLRPSATGLAGWMREVGQPLLGAHPQGVALLGGGLLLIHLLRSLAHTYGSDQATVQRPAQWSVRRFLRPTPGWPLVSDRTLPSLPEIGLALLLAPLRRSPATVHRFRRTLPGFFRGGPLLLRRRKVRQLLSMMGWWGRGGFGVRRGTPQYVLQVPPSEAQALQQLQFLVAPGSFRPTTSGGRRWVLRGTQLLPLLGAIRNREEAGAERWICRLESVEAALERLLKPHRRRPVAEPILVDPELGELRIVPSPDMGREPPPHRP